MWHCADMARDDTRTPAEIEALALLDDLTRKYREAERQLEEVRDEVSAAIVRILKAKTLGPSEVTRHVPFERQHVGRIAKAGGVEPLRPPTVEARRKARDVE